jgi:hypothetical protein
MQKQVSPCAELSADSARWGGSVNENCSASKKTIGPSFGEHYATVRCVVPIATNR